MDKIAWQGSQGANWAENWRRTDRSFGILTENLLSRLRALEFREVLDVGCGAGELSLAIARNRPGVQVRGLDISPQLVEAAQARGDRFTNVTFVCEDASTWKPDDSFALDQLVSRHGVMFFDDPVAAFSNLASVSAPAAGLMFSCFREPSLNPFMSEVARLLPEPPQSPDPRAPGPFAFADASYVEQILSAAGWADTTFSPVDFPMIVGAGEDPVADAREYFCTIGPAARALGQLDEEEREAFLIKLDALCGRHCREGIVSLPAAAWVVTAQRG
ncbi:class I SAM-dependent methyltransferase [Aurantiacibacter suaedae]|uniref:class I SAM-dependent methyltransferase n=1 Tax=Aurantiacibacter suaedae TaxID=2545755 RepID=UPI001F4F2FA2|nr:class I SAM-dependent methyltransferase [Aurantiacibacter suaedae]